MWILIALLTGVLIGLMLAKFIYRDRPIGNLRVDNSDPDSGPYLFLELSKGLESSVLSKKYVMLRVKIENYISHK